MVNLIECGRYEFIRRMNGKKVYCFGAGKYLEEFFNEQYGVEIAGIIDNYRYTEESYKKISNVVLKIISVDMLQEIYDDNCVVVITCQAFDEVLEQLDSIERFNDMECYIELFVRNETEHTEICADRECREKIIPKKIHYCWFGGMEMPNEYKKNIESWKKYCPDYEIVRWDETNYDIHKNIYISQAAKNKKWAFVSDYARVDILYHEGGLYFDTDVELVKNFDDFLKWKMFCGFERPEMVAWGLGFGSVRGEKVLKDVLDVYENMTFINDDGTVNLITCPVIQSNTLKKYGFEMNGQFQERDGVAIYPKEYFAPLGYIRGFGRITENTYSIHHYTASWTDSQQKRSRLKMEEKIARVRERCKSDKTLHNAQTKNTRRFQIWECLEDLNTAGGKAPADVKNILNKAGYRIINIHPYKGEKGTNDCKWSHRRLEQEWKTCYDLIPTGSVLFLQHPFCQIQEERNETLHMLKEHKQVKIIVLVHDVEKLRNISNDLQKQAEFDYMIKIADVIIVHNNSMMRYFIELGVSEKRLVSLGLFDYLYDKQTGEKIFERSITIAGNLETAKSPYIRDLKKLAPLKVHLYGPNYEKSCAVESEINNIEYHGSFLSEKIPEILKGGFGLVWDGESLDSCKGPTGTYLKYNNPHKLSLYLAAGLPVIVWKKAAAAEFVEAYGVGFTIDSLYQIEEILNNMNEIQYKKYLHEVQKISDMLQQGEYTKLALEEGEKILQFCAE